MPSKPGVAAAGGSKLASSQNTRNLQTAQNINLVIKEMSNAGKTLLNFSINVDVRSLSILPPGLGEYAVTQVSCNYTAVRPETLEVISSVGTEKGAGYVVHRQGRARRKTSVARMIKQFQCHVKCCPQTTNVKAGSL